MDNDKADQLKFVELKKEVEELKQVVNSFDDGDEYDEEDSVEEDVLSLNREEGEQSFDQEEDEEEIKEVEKVDNISYKPSTFKQSAVDYKEKNKKKKNQS